MADIKTITLPDGNTYNLKDNRIYYGTCTTTSSTQEKSVTIDGFTSSSLVGGTRIVIEFTNGNSAADPTLNVSSTGAKPILTSGYYSSSTGSHDTSRAVQYEWKTGLVSFVYDGYAWTIEGGQHASTTYWGKTKLSNTISNDETVALTPKAVNDAGYLTSDDVTATTTTVNSITAVGTLPSLTTTVTNKVLTIGWSTGTLPTKGVDTTVLTGISTGSTMNDADVTPY